MRLFGGDMATNSVDWPIFVISLPVATERRAILGNKLAAAGLAFQFIDAVDGRNGLAPEWEARIDRPGAHERYGYPMSDGEFACSLSHQLAYVRVLEQGLPGAVILEDDAILTPAFAQFYRQGHYRKADFIQLFCFAARIWRGPGRRSVGVTRLHGLAENAFSTVAYSISARGAAYLHQAGQPVRSRSDWPAELSRIGGLLAVPSVVLHPPPTMAQSYLADSRAGLVPDGFDYSARYVKGWRRLITPASWASFVRKKLSREIAPGFPLPDD
ncbi:MAG: hypothetical protein C0524_18315 [Rhodobacter sp.]|nr:hypothetical protein [Rhodobacter sp.]